MAVTLTCIRSIFFVVQNHVEEAIPTVSGKVKIVRYTPKCHFEVQQKICFTCNKNIYI